MKKAWGMKDEREGRGRKGPGGVGGEVWKGTWRKTVGAGRGRDGYDSGR